jgi:galactokinase
LPNGLWLHREYKDYIDKGLSVVMQLIKQDNEAVAEIIRLSNDVNINVAGGKLRRTSSRFCFGVEHGDYNGTELFGVGTDRFIWLAYKPNDTGTVRIFSGNFPDDGVIEFALGRIPEAKSVSIAHSWARFPFGADYILRREGFKLHRGIDAIVFGNIPGGGMSRSASLTLNLILSLLDANGIELKDQFKIVEMAQAVENDYIGSPCGQLDQIMILFARADMGTYFDPKSKSVSYVPLGADAPDFRIVVLDTGTVRPGLEKSTYKIRRAECEQMLSLLNKSNYGISSLADLKTESVVQEILGTFEKQHPNLCMRLRYIFAAQKRFYEMLDGWKKGDIATVGRIFRQDGIGLRDDYQISGPELETMCDIARTVPGVLGERMLGGGDKGAAGALVLGDNVKPLKTAVDTAYPRSHPLYADKYAVHACKLVDGVTVFDGLLGH